MLQCSPYPTDFTTVLERVHAIGRGCVAPCAAEVDREARFPHEALEALKAEKLLGAYVPLEYGGLGMNVKELAQICEALGQYCASTALVYAMHQIQVGCLVHHGLGAAYFRDYVAELAAEQYLLASATSEMGVGGDLRSSICAVEVSGDRFALVKQAPVISYGAAADAILVTCRRAPDAVRNDQVLVLARREDYRLELIAGWDSLGFRGTCSSGFVLRCEGRADHIVPVPFALIHSKTMHPLAHTLWASVWLGLATDALNRARRAVRAEARKSPGTIPPSAGRLAEADIVLFSMRSALQSTLAEYQGLLAQTDSQALDGAFVIRINNLKIASAQQLIDIVGRAMMICGIAGYKNDSELSLARHLRDAYGASVMVNNDRILGHNATMHIAQKAGLM
jgi:acyl-CoA dehydrogenase